MKLSIFFLLVLFAVTNMRVQSQSVGIGTLTPDSSAALDVSSTSKGMLVPRLTSGQRELILSPGQGLLVYDVTTQSFWFHNTNEWTELVDKVNTEVHRNGPDMIYMGMTDHVGVGTMNPSYKLEVKTDVYDYGLAHTNGIVELATKSANNGGGIGTKSNHPFRLYANDGVNQFVMMPNGNVGLGLYESGFPLAFAATTGDKISFYGGQPGQHYGIGIAPTLLQIHADASFSDIGFGYGSSESFTELMRIKGNGDVGIGINPTNRLDIQSGSPRSGTHPSTLPMYITGDMSPGANGFEIRHNNSLEGIGLGYNTVYATGSSENQSLGLASRGTGFLFFNTNNITRAWITGEGRVGIGSDNPQASLFVTRGSGPNGTAEFAGTSINSHFNYAVEENTFIRGGKPGADVILNDLSSLGNVGIGTSNPVQKLHVAGKAFIRDSMGIGTSSPGFPLSFSSTTGDKISLFGSSGNHFGLGVSPALLQIHTDLASSDIGFGHGSSTSFTELMRIKGNGNVGIGTSVPDQLFSVSNKLGIDALGSIRFKNDVANMMFMYTGVSSANKMVVAHSASFPDWGLQYVGATNSFRFLQNNMQVMAVNLGANNVEVNGALKVGYIRVATDPVSAPGLAFTSASCPCPTGTVVVGGGHDVNFNGIDVTDSRPNSDTSWFVNVYNTNAELAQLVVWAICARFAN